MIALALSLPLMLQANPLELDRQAVDAYRRKDYSEASALWEDALALSSGPQERSRLLFNLGNSAFRQENYTRAVGWYTAAQRLTPRDGSVWKNLELARSEADLDPADRGDLSDTTRRLIGSFTREEAEWLLLGALVLWGIALAGEALRGGRTWRRLIGLGLLLVIVCALPLGWHAGGKERPLMVVQTGGGPGALRAAQRRLRSDPPEPGNDRRVAGRAVRLGGRRVEGRAAVGQAVGRFRAGSCRAGGLAHALRATTAPRFATVVRRAWSPDLPVALRRRLRCR